MKKYQFLLLALAALVSAACGPKYANKAEKVVAELHNPNSKYVVVVAHRGDWRNYPENSIPAIESVIRMGVDIVELDLKMTSDSVLVLSHDGTCNRTTTGKGPISTMTFCTPYVGGDLTRKPQSKEQPSYTNPPVGRIVVLATPPLGFSTGAKYCYLVAERLIAQSCVTWLGSISIICREQFI